MTDFDLEPKEFEVNLDILESENTAQSMYSDLVII